MDNSDNSVESVERLKSIIIEHVAKDVLILSESVDELMEKLKKTEKMMVLLEENISRQFDLAVTKITDYLEEQEKHLAEQAHERIGQVNMTITDKVENLLIDKFKKYQTEVDQALDKFKEANIAAVDNLSNLYEQAEQQIKHKATREPGKKGLFGRKK